MHIVLLTLAAATLLFVAGFGIDIFLGNRSTAFLRDIPVDSPGPTPRISVVIPARDEQRGIRQALQSVLAQNYPDVEYIVINDRSTDRTGSILAEMARQDARLRVITISELPAGWLGKNYALYTGAEAASGDLILFADADVVMDRTVLARAAAYMRRQQLQHLAILPEIRMPGVLLGMFIVRIRDFLRDVRPALESEGSEEQDDLWESARSISFPRQPTARPARTKSSPCAPTTTSNWESCSRNAATGRR